MFHKLWFQKYF